MAIEADKWNPPVKTEIPIEAVSKSSILQPSNIRQSKEELLDLAKKTGKQLHELVSFSAERMALHSTIVLTNTRIQVPSNSDSYFSFGKNFRNIVKDITSNYISPDIKELEKLLDSLYHDTVKDVTRDVRQLMESNYKSMLLQTWVMSSSETGGYLPTDETYYRMAKYGSLYRNYELLKERQSKGLFTPKDDSEFESTLISLVTNESFNSAGNRLTDRFVDKLISKAIKEDNYKEFPVYDKDSITYIIKGASASGKSTARPRFQKATEQLGKNWEEVMKLNPDIWRPLLLDAETLGEHKPYWGTLTDNELTIVSNKISNFINNKDIKHPHMLLDRFFPDTPELLSAADYSKETHLVLMFTSPENLIERAFERGQILNRYMPIDTILANTVITNLAIPKYLTNALDKNIKFEIVDNSVPKGEQPITIAFGDLVNKEMNIIDISGLIKMEQYTKVNKSATSASELFSEEDIKPENNLSQLKHYAQKMLLNFIDPQTKEIYVSFSSGKMTVYNQGLLDKSISNDKYSAAAFEELSKTSNNKHIEQEISRRSANVPKGMVGRM